MLSKYANTLNKAKQRACRSVPPASPASPASPWPQLIDQSCKQQILDNFRFHTSASHLEQCVCAVCSELKFASQMMRDPMPLKDYDLSLYTNRTLLMLLAPFSIILS